MSGFFPHTGGSPSGYSALPASTSATLLDDIVADVTAQAGTNGWSIYDDQRSSYTPLFLPSNTAGLNRNQGVILTNGAQSLAQATYGRFKRNWIAGSSQISVDQSNWYTVNTLTSQVAAVIDRNYTGTTTTATTGHQLYEKSGPYVVLKCTSSQKTFYVLLVRPVSYGVSLKIQVYETWNASTHVGTSPGPMEELRAFESGPTLSTNIQYCLFLLPDVFAIWACGDLAYPSGVPQADFFYCGNLNPLRVGDNTCLIQACSNQDLSGISPVIAPAFNTANTFVGGATMFKNIAGAMWAQPTTYNSYGMANNYILMPRGSGYMFGLDRTNLDDAAKFQFCEVDAFWGGSPGSGFDKNEGKRGELRYLKCPVMNPSGLHLASLGPADDGNTYMLLRSSYPQAIDVAISTYVPYDIPAGVSPPSGFYASLRTGILGEVNSNPSYMGWGTRWFMMPINL